MEFDLIERIRRRVLARDDVPLGIGDDCALLIPRVGQRLAVTTDALNAGVHFPAATAPFDIGWKSLAVNLSDLAAIGAEPAWCTLSLSLPEADSGWLDRFLDGFCALAEQHAVALVGGDTTRGPLSIAVTAFGFVPSALALCRDRAQRGDDIWITGTLGDAAAALRHCLDDSATRVPSSADGDALRARLDRPTPRMAAGMALRGLAHACIDVSDGLLADLGHVLQASEVGAEIDLDALPGSVALQAAVAVDERRVLQLTGGDDYELCFTAPPEHRDAIAAALAHCATPATVIGRITAPALLRVLAADGSEWRGSRRGYDHFAGDAA
jgi:thiamine-monophosphate kinase